MAFRLTLLGGLRVTRDEVEVGELVRQPQRTALLVYLALERSATRQQVLSTLWPDASGDRARHVLNQMLYQVRTTLGQDVIVSRGERLEVAPNVSTDASDFSNLVKNGEVARALALYGGSFLNGVELTDAPAFEHWLEGHRGRLSRLHRTARRRFLDESTAREDWNAALQCARDWVRVDALEDEAQHRLIELLARHGSRSEALKHFDLYVKSLKELGLEPLAETVALATQLRAPLQPARPQPGAVVERRGLEPLVDLVTRPTTGRQVLAIYMAIAWFVVQFAGTVFPLFGVASWAVTAVVVAGAGLPFAIFFALRANGPDPLLSRIKLNPTYVRVGVAVAIVMGSGGWVARQLLWQGTDAQLVAVLPFHVVPGTKDYLNWRKDLVHMFHTSMDGEGPFRAADPQNALGDWERRGGTDTKDLDQTQVSKYARRLHANWILKGDMVVTKATVTLSASLTEALTFKDHPAQHVSGPIDSLGVLVERLSGMLQAEATGQDVQRVATLSKVPLPAINAFLRGSELLRVGDYSGAFKYLSRAVDIDSTFAIAALKLTHAQGWSGLEYRTNPEMLAVRQKAHLGERDRAFLEAWQGTEGPNRYTARTLLQGSLNYVNAAPDAPEAWFMAGDRQVHSPYWTSRDPYGEAERYFKKAMELDPNYHEPLDHLIEIEHRKGDTAQIRHWRDQYFKTAKNPDRGFYIQWRSAYALGEKARLDSLRKNIDKAEKPSLNLMLEQSMFDGFGFDDAELVLAELERRALTPADVNGARRARALFLINRGRPQEALALLRDQAIPGASAAPAVGMISWALASSSGIEKDTMVLRGLREMRTRLDSIPAGLPDISAPSAVLDTNDINWRWRNTEGRRLRLANYWTYATYQALYGPTDSARALVARIGAWSMHWPYPPEPRVVTMMQRDFPTAVAALNALIDWRLGKLTPRQLERVDSLAYESGISSANVVTFALFNIYRGMNRLDDAAQMARMQRSGVIHATRFLAIARAAKARGDRQEAARLYKALLALRQNVEPSLKAWRDTVAAEYAQVARR